MKINLMTTCTSSGTSPVTDDLDGRNLEPSKTHSDFATRWKKLQDKHSKPEELISAEKLYAGQGFQMALRVKELLESAGHEVNFYILSIGYGLIKPNQKIAPYNLSLIYNKETGPSMYHLIEENFRPSTWWRMISKAHTGSETPIADVSDKDILTLICTSNTFLSMIVEDAFEASLKSEGLFITGLSAPGQLVKWTRKLYNGGHILIGDRHAVDGICPGNRYDFPQRTAFLLSKELIKAKIDNVATATAEIPKFFEPIKRGSPEVKPSINLSEVITNLKEGGKSFDEAFQLLQFSGTPIARSTLEAVWIPGKAILNKEIQDDALSALAEVVTSEPEGDIEALELLQILGGALAAANKVGHCVDSPTMCNWAKSFCEKSQRELPGRFKSAHKLTHLVRRLGSLYGFVELETHSGGGIQFQYNPITTTEADVSG